MLNPAYGSDLGAEEYEWEGCGGGGGGRKDTCC